MGGQGRLGLLEFLWDIVAENAVLGLSFQAQTPDCVIEMRTSHSC